MVLMEREVACWLCGVPVSSRGAVSTRLDVRCLGLHWGIDSGSFTIGLPSPVRVDGHTGRGRTLNLNVEGRRCVPRIGGTAHMGHSFQKE